MDEVFIGSSDAGSRAPWGAAGKASSLFLGAKPSVFAVGTLSLFVGAASLFVGEMSSGFGLSAASPCEGEGPSLFAFAVFRLGLLRALKQSHRSLLI